MTEAPARTWKEIATSFLKIGATAYGGPAIMGVMQASSRRRSVGLQAQVPGRDCPRERAAPGATANRSAIPRLRAGRLVAGGLLGNGPPVVCFAPRLVVHARARVDVRDPRVSPDAGSAVRARAVVVAIFIVALFRLVRSPAMRALPHRLIAAGAAVPRP